MCVIIQYRCLRKVDVLPFDVDEALRLHRHKPFAYELVQRTDIVHQAVVLLLREFGHDHLVSRRGEPRTGVIGLAVPSDRQLHLASEQR